MDIKPNIRKGFGPMSTRGWNKIANKANERSPANDARGRKKPNGSELSTYIAWVNSYTTIIAGRRFRYTVTECKWNNTTFQFEEDSTKTSETAYNTIEALQQNSGAEDGPGITHAYITGGFFLNAVVAGTVVIVTNINGIRFFCVTNAIDGTCDT